MKILAIDSSSLVASVAVVEDDIMVAEYTINHKKTHSQTLLPMIDEIVKMAEIRLDDIDAIAVTYAPGLLGSLLVGVEFAKTMSFVYKKPLIAVNHIAGHIYANNLEKPMQFPLLALVVSGGHTDLILMKGDYQFEHIGGTLDDAIGECYDKVARVIGLGYPGGPKVEKAALEGEHTYDLPIPMNDDSFNMSFSGLKSNIINLVHNEKQRGNDINKEDLATSFQDVAVDILAKKTIKALKEFNITIPEHITCICNTF